MNRTTIIILSVVGVFFFIILGMFLWGMGVYNSMVKSDESINSAWSQVENQYQRRYDLIPNLVNTVKGYAEHEKEVLEQVTEARARVGSIQATKEVVNDPRLFQKFQEAQSGFSTAISRLLAVAENYPNLKANENFLQLQAQLEGTENRIAVERKRFNEVVQEYNTRIRVFPGSFIASMFGFTQKEYFKSESGTEKAPKVEF
ncbi:MAG: LemA family protein [Bacteroidetes bacterium]|nr:MAG: LemA family protein [Bacteroidota bacterium]